MLRIANPGSDIDGFIRIFGVLFEELVDRQPFTLDDMSEAMVRNNLATSCGFMGEKALELSTRSDRSRDPLYNQSKMYSELYRTLGWIHPTERDRLRFYFTYLGAHVAHAVEDPRALTRESLLGIAYPNEVVDVKAECSLRPFACILRTFASLDGLLCRDEMIVGPLSLGDDRDDRGFEAMVAMIRRFRATPGALEEAIAAIERTRGITKTTMENYTRFPLAALTWAGWATKSRRKDIYPKSTVFLELTEPGRRAVSNVAAMKDVRARDLAELTSEERNAVCRLAAHAMLERAGFDLEPIAEQLRADRDVCEGSGKAREYAVRQLLFSPMQELAPRICDECFPVVGTRIDASRTPSERARGAGSSAAVPARQTHTLRLRRTATRKLSRSPLRDELEGLVGAASGDTIRAAERFATAHATDTQTAFYPLVAELFTIAGVEATTSRAGVNYQRFDAIIPHTARSIPIEIKSPSKELFLSAKAVRQAAENKVVLLAREGFKTDREATSLAVGFNAPNDRSEVIGMIDDMRKAFGIRIGVVDLRTLVQAAMLAIVDGRVLAHDELVELHGFMELSAA